jgi:hypothetical protein
VERWWYGDQKMHTRHVFENLLRHWVNGFSNKTRKLVVAVEVEYLIYVLLSEYFPNYSLTFIHSIFRLIRALAGFQKMVKLGSGGKEQTWNWRSRMFRAPRSLPRLVY